MSSNAEKPAAIVSTAIQKYNDMPGGLMPLLHEIQAMLGHIPKNLVSTIASGMGLSRAEVHGVISFYHDFHDKPRGQTTIHLCRAEACQAMGSRKLEQHVKARLIAWVTVPVHLRSVLAMTSTHVLMRSASINCWMTAGMVKVFIPADTTACALGADTLAAEVALQARGLGLEIEIIRNGSRGAAWLEPLVEIESEHGRIAFGPVSANDVFGLFDAGFPEACEHELYRGKVSDIEWLARQDRLTFVRAGKTDPLSLDDYKAHGGFQGLDRALKMSPADIVEAVTASGLRGRGGAAFPTGIKWRTVLDAPAGQKYVVANADEGDSGTFADRLLMEADPYQLIEGMTICAMAVGASEGYIYLRSEYPKALRVLEQAIASAQDANLLGDNIRSSGRDFHLQVRVGAGAYICGEETSLLESLEGKRGLVRFKPPLPAIEGLFGKPTVVNNVLTLSAVTTVLALGADYYRDYGTGRSRGTLTVQLGGNVLRGGLVEIPFGASLRELVEDFGGGTASGKPVRAIQVGGPLGAYLPESLWDTPLDYESFAAVGAMLGHGGVVVFDDSVDMLEQARFAMEFCAVESCGKCTPCRIGSVRGAELLDKIGKNDSRQANLELLEELCETMDAGSLCAMGGLTPMPVRSAIRHFPQDFKNGADR
jgi:formate dehydrogenase iron-sulfur subunit